VALCPHTTEIYLDHCGAWLELKREEETDEEERGNKVVSLHPTDMLSCLGVLPCIQKWINIMKSSLRMANMYEQL